MSQNQVQQIEEPKTVIGKTVLSVTKPTPVWATWMFRIVFILTGVALFVIVADPEFSNQFKIRATVYLKGLDMLVWAVTRVLGVDVARDYNVPQTPQP